MAVVVVEFRIYRLDGVILMSIVVSTIITIAAYLLYLLLSSFMNTSEALFIAGMVPILFIAIYLGDAILDTIVKNSVTVVPTDINSLLEVQKETNRLLEELIDEIREQ